MTGEELISALTDSIDLPKHLIKNELGILLADQGLEESEVTVDQLREVLANYLQDVLPSVKEAIR